MRNFSTWLLVLFMVIFWIIRMIVAVTYEMGMDFVVIEPFIQNMEIILFFVVFLLFSVLA